MLNQDFFKQLNDLDENSIGGYEPLAEGWYTVIISDVQQKFKDDGKSFLEVDYMITEGESAGKYIKYADKFYMLAGYSDGCVKMNMVRFKKLLNACNLPLDEKAMDSLKGSELQVFYKQDGEWNGKPRMLIGEYKALEGESNVEVADNGIPF